MTSAANDPRTLDNPALRIFPCSLAPSFENRAICLPIFPSPSSWRPCSLRPEKLGPGARNSIQPGRVVPGGLSLVPERQLRPDAGLIRETERTRRRRRCSAETARGRHDATFSRRLFPAVIARIRMPRPSARLMDPLKKVGVLFPGRARARACFP